MNLKETYQVLTILQTAYPMFYKGLTQKQVQDTANLWQWQFSHVDYNTVMAAVNRLISTRTETFPPNIGIVHEMVRKISHPEDLTPEQAWSYVLKAMRNGTYNSHEEWERLPEVVQKAVTPEQIRSWAMENELNLEVASSNFQKSYREVRERNREEQVIPENVRQMIDAAIGQKKIGEGNGGGDRRYRLPENQ